MLAFHVVAGLYLGSLEDILNRLRDLGTNTVTLNQSNSVLALHPDRYPSVSSPLWVVGWCGKFVRCDSRRGWRRQAEKNAICWGKTYIGALLALELGDGIVGGASETAQLKKIER